jgi:hypothetical protein
MMKRGSEGGVTMTLRRRVERLESSGGGDGCGPGCPPCLFRLYRQEGLGEPVLVECEGSDSPCPRCGRPAKIEELLEIIISSREEVEALRALEAVVSPSGETTFTVPGS